MGLCWKGVDDYGVSLCVTAWTGEPRHILYRCLYSVVVVCSRWTQLVASHNIKNFALMSQASVFFSAAVN